MLTEFSRNCIKDFWDWVEIHKDYVGVQYLSESQFYLYLAFDHDILDEFTSRYQHRCEEGGCACLMQVNGLCFDMNLLEGGYDFTMQELWESRPDGIEHAAGRNVY